MRKLAITLVLVSACATTGPLVVPSPTNTTVDISNPRMATAAHVPANAPATTH